MPKITSHLQLNPVNPWRFFNSWLLGLLRSVFLPADLIFFPLFRRAGPAEESKFPRFFSALTSFFKSLWWIVIAIRSSHCSYFQCHLGWSRGTFRGGLYSCRGPGQLFWYSQGHLDSFLFVCRRCVCWPFSCSSSFRFGPFIFCFFPWYCPCWSLSQEDPLGGHRVYPILPLCPNPPSSFT